ncbi:MAG TPA: glycogen/starch synthase, partial [Chitinophagaceae bacterium]
GALPKYQSRAGHFAKVVMPMHRTKFLYENDWVVDAKGQTNMGNWFFEYTVIKEAGNKLGFDLFLIDIHGLLDRDRIYGYDDDVERFTAFQIAVVHWLSRWEHQPDVIHCHDHHTAFIPFMLQHCYQYRWMSNIKTVLTIHNAQYQGWMGWDKSYYIPAYDTWKAGLLEWAGTINPLACGIKCAWKVTTVSWSYLDELRYSANGLEALFEYEKGKCSGLLNGIDYEVWNPKNDQFLTATYSDRTVTAGKNRNKKAFCAEYGLDPEKPLCIFIGRLVGEKAADLLPDSISASVYATDGAMNFFVLGSGETAVESRLIDLRNHFGRNYNCFIGYDEAMSHRLYAAADFLLMPSRVEPCGLNQMYAMRYGTVPMVRSTGGLIDTVVDMGDPAGFGIRFNHASVGDIVYSVQRAVSVYQDKKHMRWMRQHMMKIDHSWEGAVQQYMDLYGALV